MRAIIDSIHSQATVTIADLKARFDLILSLDSHLDVSLGGDDSVYPPELRMIARRTGAHTAMRELLDEMSQSRGELLVAIPERMFGRHAEDIESSLPLKLRVANRKESAALVAGFLRMERGIEVFQSPPSSLLDLLPRVRRASSWLLDIDVDYMQEMQSECYTKIIRPDEGVLQSASRVVEFIRSARPETIVLSEARVDAIRNQRSNFSRFARALSSLGYRVEEDQVAASDSDITRGISDCKAFYNSVSRKLLTEHLGEMVRGDLRGFMAAEQTAAKRFFVGRGYKMGGEEVGRE